MSLLKLNRQEKFLFVIPAVILLIPLIYQFRGDDGDKLNRSQRHLSGAAAVDCGVGQITTAENNVIYQKRGEADACAAAAFKANKPYYVRYNNKIADGSDGPEMESSGSVRTPQGQVYFFYYRYSDNWWSNWWEKEYDYVEALCPKPVVYRKAVGCGTCVKEASVDTASCIIHPSDMP